MTSPADTFSQDLVDFYVTGAQRGETLHRSAPESILREVTALQVPPSARVLEIGTGTGYSGAVLVERVGPHGQVTSVDVSDHLVGWANLLHYQRGITNVRCYTADGLAGFPAGAPYDCVVAWCTPPRLPRSWTEQLAPGGRLVACLPIAELPSTTLIAAITVHAGQPQVQAVTFGGYAQSTPGAVEDALTIPGRWVDWSIRHPAPSWIAIGWRHDDDWLRTGARTALDRLLIPEHTEHYDGAPLDWPSWAAFTAVMGDPQLSIAALRGETRGIGHTTATSAAVLQTDGVIIADSPHSPSLTALRTWLHRWEHAGRPAADVLTPTLIPNDADGCPGWDLRAAF